MATVNVDIPATQMVVVNPDGGGTIVTGDLGDIDAPGDILMVGGTITPGSTLNVAQWGDGPFDGSFTLPDAPDGYPILSAAYYTVIAYRLEDEARSIFPPPGFGLIPDPEDSPFLQANAGANAMVIDHIPVGVFGLAVGRVSENLFDLEDGSFSDQWSVGAYDGTASYDAHLHIGYFGLRLVYSDGVTEPSPSTATTRPIFRPLRQYPRSDGLGASSARRLYPPSRSIQASNRRAGGYL